jgi:head-tail adaptor
MTQSGKLDTLIYIYLPVADLDATGEPSGEPESVCAVWAEYRPARGRDSQMAGKTMEQTIDVFRSRYSAEIKASMIVRTLGIDPDPEMPPPITAEWDIVSVSMIGRREGLDIIARRKA